jgi:two-component system sensor histidine kinase DesK
MIFFDVTTPGETQAAEAVPSRRPYVWLYLGFLGLAWQFSDHDWVLPTLASLPVFFFLYLRHVGPGRRFTLLQVLALAALSYALQRFNPFANTYLAYAAAFTPMVLPGLLRPLLLTGALLAVHAAVVLLLGQPPFLIAISALIMGVSCLGNAYALATGRRDEALRLTQAEVRRLATLAERERIGRDLHDLLGHTLSLVALKGELAGKLVAPDPQAAAREIAEVAQIARDALVQVRSAVTGMRAAALAGELAAARALLRSCGVELTTPPRQAPSLPPQIETALAMILREAATNIQRHAAATQASVEIEGIGPPAGVALRISDNGRGGIRSLGNGLAGIGERVRLLGGSLQIDSPPGAGTVLTARLPVTP